MTTTSGSARLRRRSATVATTMVEAPEPIIESIGLDGPEMAHGGHPRRTPGPPVNGGVVTRVRPSVVPPTRVRRVDMAAKGVVRRGGLSAAIHAAPTPDSTAEAALLGS